MNEFIFIFHTLIVSLCSLGMLFLGKEALISYICLQSILANLFVAKQMTIFGLSATCSDVFVVGSLFSLNLLQEFFGKDSATKAILINFSLLFFYLAMTQFHMWYIPNHFDTMHGHFSAILQIAPRIIAASTCAFLVMQLVDVYLFSFLKKLFSDKYPSARNFIALSVSMIIDTILFTLLGLYGIVGSVWHVIIISSAIKIIATLCCIPFTTLAKKIKT
ncbi:MAG: queuosine precursor transporter [bacterium]